MLPDLGSVAVFHEAGTHSPNDRLCKVPFKKEFFFEGPSFMIQFDITCIETDMGDKAMIICFWGNEQARSVGGKHGLHSQEKVASKSSRENKIACLLWIACCSIISLQASRKRILVKAQCAHAYSVCEKMPVN